MKRYKPTTKSRRQMSTISYRDYLSGHRPEKSLTRGRKRDVGRTGAGRISVRHKGAGNKRRYRDVDFSLEKMISIFYQGQGSIIAVHEERGDISKRGIVEVDSAGRVVHFLEKPHISQTNSRLASSALYVLRKEDLSLVEQYLQITSELTRRDAPGNFIAWLYTKVPVFSFKISGRYDVGSLQDYLLTTREFIPKART